MHLDLIRLERARRSEHKQQRTALPKLLRKGARILDATPPVEGVPSQLEAASGLRAIVFVLLLRGSCVHPRDKRATQELTSEPAPKDCSPQVSLPAALHGSISCRSITATHAPTCRATCSERGASLVAAREGPQVCSFATATAGTAATAAMAAAAEVGQPLGSRYLKPAVVIPILNF